MANAERCLFFTRVSLLERKSAAGFFQESIDISLHLLAGNNITAAGGITETSADAVDVVSTYNRLGLALKDSGVDVVAAKEAFLAGLSVAPEDMTLLINGGVAHQVLRVEPAETIISISLTNVRT